MLRFFRKIRLNLIQSNKVKHYFAYAIGEIILVVLGILIALQVNNWNEQRKEKKLEVNYLTNLLLDIERDIDELEFHKNTVSNNKRSAENVIKFISSNAGSLREVNLTSFTDFPQSAEIKNDTLLLIESIARAHFMRLPKVHNFTFENIVSSGNQNIISNDSLKRHIFDYYSQLKSFDDWVRQKRNAQDRLLKVMPTLISPFQRMFPRTSIQAKQKLLKRDVNAIALTLNSVHKSKELIPLLNDVIYAQERLLSEDDDRIALSKNMAEHLKNELEIIH